MQRSGESKVASQGQGDGEVNGRAMDSGGGAGVGKLVCVSKGSMSSHSGFQHCSAICFMNQFHAL